MFPNTFFIKSDDYYVSQSVKNSLILCEDDNVSEQYRKESLSKVDRCIMIQTAVLCPSSVPLILFPCIFLMLAQSRSQCLSIHPYYVVVHLFLRANIRSELISNAEMVY